jgi:sec-independent protein translocase protein TatA
MGLIINWSPGGYELIIILIIVLILFGANRLPDIARGMVESIENFKRAAPWISRKQRWQSDDPRAGWLVFLAVIPVSIIFSVLSLDVFSAEQKFVVTIVLLGWIGVGYLSFGRNLRK